MPGRLGAGRRVVVEVACQERLVDQGLIGRIDLRVCERLQFVLGRGSGIAAETGRHVAVVSCSQVADQSRGEAALRFARLVVVERRDQEIIEFVAR